MNEVPVTPPPASAVPKKPLGPPDPTETWHEWKASASDEAFDRTLRGLQPVINVALASYGAGGDPVLRAHARAIAGEAIRTYDPASGAGLPTWATQQMLRLKRIRRNTGNVVRLPERVVLDSQELDRVSREFLDEHDREPTVEELARLANLSRKRVADVLQMRRRTPTEEAIGEQNLLLNAGAPELEEALDMVYEDADNVDRKLLEWRAGYGGAPLLPANVAAQKLKLSPFAVSRRTQRLALKIRKIERDLQRINAGSAFASGGAEE